MNKHQNLENSIPSTNHSQEETKASNGLIPAGKIFGMGSITIQQLLKTHQ